MGPEDAAYYRNLQGRIKALLDCRVAWHNPEVEYQFQLGRNDVIIRTHQEVIMRNITTTVALIILLVLLFVGNAAAGYTNNGDGTVTDNVSGLIWQKCSAEQNYQTCSGAAMDMVWADALTYCNNLALGGGTAWRLPDVMELKSLADSSRHDPAINTTYFPSTVSTGYWSSTTYVYYSTNSWCDYAWYVNFHDGFVYNYGKSNHLYVRCVRGGQLIAYLKISANANGTGSGSVVSTPSGISYIYPKTKTDAGQYTKGSTVTISAKANSLSKATWNGTCAALGGTETGNGTSISVCTIKVTKAATVTATFKK
jgi:hypothetical protein